MGEQTKIQWTDYTFNPWRGCTKVHTGCAHCYAEREAKRFPKNRGLWGPNGTRVKASEEMWRQPLKWNREAQQAGERKRVFCASLADVFEEWQAEIRDHKGGILHRCRAGHTLALDAVFANGAECRSGCNRAAHPLTLADLRSDLFKLIDETPYLDWQLVTKRPENVRRMWPDIRPGERMTPDYAGDQSRQNAWLLTSVSDQETAEAQIPELLRCRDLVPVLGLSIEPIVGPIELWKWITPKVCRCRGNTDCECYPGLPLIDWVIIGGESGPHARPCNIEWIRDLVRQCQVAGVPCFVKQLGAVVIEDEDSWRSRGLTRLLDHRGGAPEGTVRWAMPSDPQHGGDPDDWPEYLRVREFPRLELANA